MTNPPSPIAPPPENRPAKIALIAALLSFIPGVGVVAMIAGLAGGARVRLTGVGRGRSFVGVVVGMLSLLIWAMLIGAWFQYKALERAAPAVDAGKRFIMLVGSGNVNAAKAMSADTIDTDRLTATAEQFEQLGGFVGDIKPSGGRPKGDNVQVDYELPFAKSNQLFVTEWKLNDKQPQLVDYSMSTIEDPTTQPAAKPAAKK